MKQNKLENGIDEIKGIKMTPLEKGRIFENVMASSLSQPKKLISSSWSTNLFFPFIYKRNFSYYVVIPLIIILTGSGVVFASEGSLPDSILYPIKVNVIEPIKGAIISSPVDKARYESQLATNRLTEAEKLASLGKLDAKNEKKISQLLESHTTALNNVLSQVDNTITVEQSDQIITNFHAEMNAHSRVLEMLTQENNDSKTGNNISEKARDNADKFINILKNKQEKKVDGKIEENTKKDSENKYNKKREEVQLLLDQTNNNLNVKNEGSTPQQEIINDTNKTLKEAKDLLDQSEENLKAGNRDEAYKNLIDSETRAKEADVFFKAGLKYKEKNYDNKNHRRDN